MSETSISTANEAEVWDRNFFFEYVRANEFFRFMGENENAIIQTNYELGKQAGDKIHLPLITALTGDGVSGNASLEGFEEELGNYDHQITVDWLRNAVKITKKEEKQTPIAMRDAARLALKTWSMSKMRDGIIASLMSPALDNTAYASATEAQKDAWLLANADRVLFGALKSNGSSNDHSTSLANVDNTSDKLTTTSLSLAKRMAKSPTSTAAGKGIRPYMVDEGGEWFVVFAGSLPFRDLKMSTAMQTANRDGWIRGRDNPIFKDGDLLWDGMIIVEVPEIPVISGVGAGNIDVSPVFVCGAQSLGIAFGQTSRTTTDVRDYGFRTGVGVEECRGIDKLFYNNLQHGMLTHYVAAVADS